MSSVTTRDDLWPLLTRVKRPARYAGGEWGASVREIPADGVRLCLAFPDVYEVGMSYLGYQILYALAGTLDYVGVERAYCPWVDMERAMREAGQPLCSLETRTRLAEFDVVGFTLQYELCSTNGISLASASPVVSRTCSTLTRSADSSGAITITTIGVGRDMFPASNSAGITSDVQQPRSIVSASRLAPFIQPWRGTAAL